MSRYHPPFRWMSNFKAVAIDYEYYLSLSDKPQSVCMSERQMYIMSVQNTYTAWMTRWYNTDDITEKTVQFIAAEIEALLMCGCGVPAISFTDRINAITYNDSTTTIYEDVENTWNAGGQTVISVAPELDFATGTPANIEKLTCFALRALLDSILEQGRIMNGQSAEENQDTVRTISTAMAGLSAAGGVATIIGGSAAAVVGFFGGPWLLLGLALGAVGTGIATIFMGADQSLFDNTEAIDNVYCTMQANTFGSNMTRSAFKNSLIPNDFVGGSPAEQIAAMIQPYLDDLSVYLQWLSLANQLYGASNFAVLPDCDECNVAYIYQWDFSVSNGGFVVNGAGQGSYSGGAWRLANFYVPVTYYIAAQLKKAVPIDAGINQIQIDTQDMVLGANYNSGRFVLANAATGSSPATQSTVAGSATYSFAVTQDDDEILVLARASTQLGGYSGGSGKIVKVRVYGVTSGLLPSFTGGEFI